MPQKKQAKVRAKSARRQVGTRKKKSVSVGMSGSLSFRNWSVLSKRLVAGVRGSERLTKEDLSIRINARD
jgi:hypothetical protein